MKHAILFWLLLIITFLISAKTHGRQHRLERELQGYWTVSFTSENDPWIETFWLHQRILYWSIAAVTATLLIVRFRKEKRRWNILALLIPAAATSMIVAFILTGLISVIRLIVKLCGDLDPPAGDWANTAIFGSIGFWLLTGISVALLLLSAKKHFTTEAAG